MTDATTPEQPRTAAVQFALIEVAKAERWDQVASGTLRTLKDAIEAQARPAAASELSSGEREGFMERHDGGCTCWPHVSEKDALEAIAQAAHAEYREGLRRVAPVASEGLRAALTILLVDAERVPVPIGREHMDDYRNLQRSLDRARAALASDTGSVEALDVDVNPVDMRNLLLLAEAAGDEYANAKSQRLLPHMERLQAAVDLLRKHYPPQYAERQGEDA